MTRLTKRSYYTVIALSVVAATLLVLPIQASPQPVDLAEQPATEKDDADAQFTLTQVTDGKHDALELVQDRTTTLYIVREDEQTDDAPIITSIELYEKIDVTPNEEVAGVVMRRFEEAIWEDNFVRRLDES